MSDDMIDIENKKENDQNNTAGFNSLLLLSLSADAYFKWLQNEGVLIKQDMGAYTVIHPFNIESSDTAALENAFENFIKENRFSEGSRRMFRYFLFIADDYSLYDEFYSPLLEELSKKCEQNGIIAEFDIIDLKEGTLKNVMGGKMSDRKVRKVITDTITKYKAALAAGENSGDAVKSKSNEVRRQYRELGEVRRKDVINPVIVLLIINILIFIAGFFMEYQGGEDLLKTLGIQDNELIMQGEWWRLFTSMFLHADAAHIVGNMLFLFYLGSITVRYYNNAEFFAVYFISGLCGNILSLFLTDYRSLGASGAIMGLGGLVIYRMFFGKNAKLFRKSGNYLIFAVMIVFNLFYGVVVAEANIDNYGHFGGFIGGFLVAFAISGIRRLTKNKSL